MKPIKRPSFYKMIKEPTGVLYLANIIPAFGLLESLPKGNGQPVIVIPGLTTNDMSTIPLRSFLKFKGFSCYGWNHGFNINYTQKLEDSLIKYVKKISAKHGQKVALIGWSLGGVTARILAWKVQDYVSQIISIGAPFRGLNGGTNVDWWFQIVSGQKIKDINRVWAAESESQPAVISTSIYTKNDGMVSWQHCIDEEEGAITQNIEAGSNHLGLGMNPAVWTIINNRLNQDIENWEHYDVSNLKDVRAAAFIK